MSAIDRHDWLLVTAPNGDQGYQCQKCRATAIRIPVRTSLRRCPMPFVPTLAQLRARLRVRAPPSLRVDSE